MVSRQTVDAVKPLSFTLRERQIRAIIGEAVPDKSHAGEDAQPAWIEPPAASFLLTIIPCITATVRFETNVFE